DYIHVLKEGKVIKTAGVELVAKLEADGYDGIVEE
ncbi:MAG TPA: Fe-S cluster assembly ATPase SufC, partial [Epsilonproteobacteria bacterium]|nr:Fe-S cluster assembly ATPase SufC [Campylobacterota bacterium]